MLKRIFIPVLLFAGVHAMAQKAFEPYEQPIEGTNLTFKILAVVLKWELQVVGKRMKNLHTR